MGMVKEHIVPDSTIYTDELARYSYIPKLKGEDLTPMDINTTHSSQHQGVRCR